MRAPFWFTAAMITLMGIGLGLVAYIMSSTAHAQAMGYPACGERAAMVKVLNDKYQEMPRVMAIAGQVAVMEIYVSKPGTWTILVTDPNGQACIIAAGKDWEDLPITIPGKDT